MSESCDLMITLLSYSNLSLHHLGVDLSLSPTGIVGALLDGIFDSSPPRYTVGKLCVSAFQRCVMVVVFHRTNKVVYLNP